MRLGRDGDIEEWLANDSALDRPVLSRVLDPAADVERRYGFAAAVRAAAAVSHNHLARVYEVDADGSVFAVIEWNGGVSIADRLRAGDTIPVNEFLPNAAGLAEGLAALHEAGVVHGAIDPAAIHFSAAHPAKLTAYGRPDPARESEADTRALAVSLRQALTGTAIADLRPSQVVEGLPRSVDDALDGAERGVLSAGQLATSLRAAPYTPEATTEGGWSWGWVVPAIGLLVVALVIALAGQTIDVDPDSPFLFPATPQEIPSTTAATAPQTDDTASPPSPTAPPPAVTPAVSATSYDPFGDNRVERENDIPFLLDGDPATSWRTERYFDPLPLIKAGVGVLFTVDPTPASMTVTGTPGTAYEIGWSASLPPVDTAWETVSAGTLVGGTATLPLPSKDGGGWVLWLTDLPQQAPEEYFAEIAEVTFAP